MRMVGLTGGIASRKSTASGVVAHRFGNLSDAFYNHVQVRLCKSVPQEVLRKGMGGWRKVVAVFGEKILLEDGEVDRKKLGLIAFSDPDSVDFVLRLPVIKHSLAKLFLRLLTLRLSQKILKLLFKGYKVIVLDIPLLFEAKMDKWTNTIIVVWVDPDTQLHRLLKRDRTSETDAINRIDAQMPLDLKRSKADVVIDNSGPSGGLNKQLCEVLSQVMRPLTWTELALSRKGTLLALLSSS